MTAHQKRLGSKVEAEFQTFYGRGSGTETRDWKRRDGRKCKVVKRETRKRETKTAGVENSGKGQMPNVKPTLYVIVQIQSI